MIHQLLAEFMGTALMIVFGVGVHADEVLNRTKYHGSGHLFSITTWGFGIAIVLFIFGEVYINPAMAMAQLILGNIQFEYFLIVSFVEVLGGVFGSIIVYIMYADQFKLSEKDIDPVIVRNIFSTAPAIRNLPRNFFVEMFATFVFLTGILAISAKAGDVPGMVPLAVAFLVWAVGMGLGGTTGFAMNLARDMGPRIAYTIIPWKRRASSDFQYGILVPGIAPFVGAIFAALFSKFYLGL
ncbi:MULTISPECIES: D/L-lactic acid transporter LarD [Leuconostoc]|uniref:Glycerol uptake facilitator protein n=1 Tax=Leuconostoc suionicum TaxID=1511761 RepID=A0A2N9K783_9LACO|nr:D/L-lactic acid transporter LarD [Leuconostoc suionicum]MBS1008477.1 aquaporin family protein [Leuconostoc suionicum]MDC2806405.1 aquaporin family protein [Leuconostoc suionicum]MDC2816409.1 aquaporin family protein [Leuconostoc suionicum]MDC2823917.1 aquaporin family protein [Leuconostoc suionicum]MDI6497976.1 MIP/aquaporin family protein [Leuconostoc suionicum]